VCQALILVAAIANLNLAVANIALPIRAAFNTSQTSLNLIAAGYSLGLAATVHDAGAAGDPWREIVLVAGTVLAISFSLRAAVASSEDILFVAGRVGGASRLARRSRRSSP